jgi:hypothetical protein
MFFSVYVFGENITIQYPNILKMSADGVTSFTIKTDEIGRIYEISSDSESDGNCIVVRDNNELSIQHDFINGNLSQWSIIKNLVLGSNTIQESNKKRINDEKPFVYSEISTNRSNQFIYLGMDRFLEKDSSMMVAENKNTRVINLFNSGITYECYITKENIQRKYEYEEHDRGCEVTYLNQMGDINDIRSYDFFPEKIIISANSLRSNDETVNIANYIILETYNSNLATILFPLIFLENPFQENYWQYSASSFLQEGTARYSAENLAFVDGHPWASANGFGIGDILTITMPVRSKENLTIYNGFQSKEKPYLYAENSRVKEIEVTYREIGTHKTITLLDTPEAQAIEISDILNNVGETATIDVKILSVYPGGKYKDLCIQAIVPKVSTE